MEGGQHDEAELETGSDVGLCEDAHLDEGRVVDRAEVCEEGLHVADGWLEAGGAGEVVLGEVLVVEDNVGCDICNVCCVDLEGAVGA